MRAALVGIFGLFFFASCAGVPKTHRSVSLSEIEKLIHSKATSKTDLQARFGTPSHTRSLANKEIWYFDDANAGMERFALQFDNSERLTNVLWMPWPQESESRLKTVIERYPNRSFEASRTREKYHSTDTETTYTDKSSMSIWHDDVQNRVMVLSWSIVDQYRLPSASGAEMPNDPSPGSSND